MYVYKLNEDKILFCINVLLRTIRAVATSCRLHCSTTLVIFVPVQKEDLKNHMDPYCHPLLISLSLLIKKIHIVSLPFFLLEIGWLYQNRVLLFGYPVLPMIII